MATELKEYKFRGKGSRGNSYDWKRWFNGKPWRLVRGTDFTIETRVFQTSISAAAKRVGLKARTAVENENIIIIQVVPRNDAPAAKR